MHFEDLDVELLAQRPGHLLDQRRQHVDAHAHVAGLDDGGPLGGLGDELVVLAAEPGGADDVNQRFLRGELREGDGGGRNREVEQAVRVREQRLDVGAHLDAVASEPGELAGVTPDHRRAGGVDRADQRHAVDRRNGVDERAPHAPAGAHHDQPHVGHGSPPGT